jgi:hypothetical protein
MEEDSHSRQRSTHRSLYLTSVAASIASSSSSDEVCAEARIAAAAGPAIPSITTRIVPSAGPSWIVTPSAAWVVRPRVPVDAEERPEVQNCRK